MKIFNVKITKSKFQKYCLREFQRDYFKKKKKRKEFQ